MNSWLNNLWYNKKICIWSLSLIPDTVILGSKTRGIS